ncbi:hypothetical protein BJY04DRAFT_204730 [Aspergillus karnatakaensis]|uniref:cobalamin-independent methionine synthase II family protein n=1 Tax=Aspergillus karnatakaensis TaxID=1810916 RepID=UPI003CCD5E2C
MSNPPPYRAEHVGSLLRSKELLDLWYNDHRDEGSKAADRKKQEDHDIKEAVDLQQSLGFRTITDGEIRRRLYWGTFFTDLEGMTEIQVTDLSIFRPYLKHTKLFTDSGKEGGGGTVVVCTGKIRHVKSSFLHEFEYLKTLVNPERVKDIKITASSLEMYHLMYKQGFAYPASVYESDDEYFADIAAAFRAEVHVLYDAGLRNIQIDDPNLGYFCDPQVHQGWAADSLNHRTSIEQVKQYVKLINDSISGLPDDLHVALHLCKGNFKSGHWASGGYDLIASTLFRKCNVKTFFLEFDTERSGGFAPLKELPVDKRVVLGLITTKTGQAEDLEQLQKRVHEAAKYMAEGSGESEASCLQRISVSPQCGFASANIGNQISRDGMLSKLSLVRKLADRVWDGEP